MRINNTNLKIEKQTDKIGIEQQNIEKVKEQVKGILVKMKAEENKFLQSIFDEEEAEEAKEQEKVLSPASKHMLPSLSFLKNMNHKINIR